MFGGPCHSSEFHNARKSHHLKNADGSYDTSVLQGYQDEIDGLVYAEAVRLFRQNLAVHNVSVDSCQPCFADAGVHP